METIQEESADSNLHNKSLNPNISKTEIYDRWADTYDSYVVVLTIKVLII